MASVNGTQRREGASSGATQDATRLAGGTYDERVLASMDQQRMVNEQQLLRTLGEYDPDNITHRDRRRMRQDPIIKMALWYSKAPMIRADWTMECEDPVIQAAMTEIYRNVHISLMKTALNCFDFGYQGAVKGFKLGKIEATYEDQDGNVKPCWDDPDVKPLVLGKLVPLPPETTRVHLKDGEFAGIDTPLATNGEPGSDDATIPAEWCMWFTNEYEEEFNNYYGRARLDPSYRFWYSYWFAFHMRDRHAEADADPALQVWYPPGSYKDANGEVKTNRDAALEIGAKLRGGATIAWPSDVHVDEQGKLTTQPLWRAEFLKGGENLAAFNDLLTDLEISKLRACLVPEQALVESKHGTSSRNSAATFVDIFTQSLEQSAANIDDLVNKYLLRPVIEANWGKDAPQCLKKTTGFQEEDLTLPALLIQAAFTADPNALPLDFEEMCRKAGLPVFSKKEQKDREDAAQEAKDAIAEMAPPPGAEQVPGDPVDDGSGVPAALQAGQLTDGALLLHGPKVDANAPDWARRAGRRRDVNVSALAERLRDVARSRYQDVFEAAAEAIADDADELSLGVSDAVSTLLGKIRSRMRSKVDGYRRPLESELASVYHAAGAAELASLGLSSDSWDVGRQEVQDWARRRGGELITTMDETVVEKHIRPWLEKVLADPANSPHFIERGQGIAIDALGLSAELTDRFQSYPQWMADRVVRSEARMGYNQSAADMWERVGVEQVTLFDGLGGRSGKSDAHCLDRNGKVVSVQQFRLEDEDEHPNGTLGAVPVTVGVKIRPPAPGVVQTGEVLASQSIYAVTGDGLILSEAETGRLLGGE
jgi:hypothetical protein